MAVIKLNGIKFEEKFVDENRIKDVAQAYKEIEDTISQLKEEQKKIENILLEARVEEYFPDKTKLIYQEGRIKVEVDTHKVVASLTYDELLQIMKIQVTDLKRLSRKKDKRFGEKVYMENSKETGKGNPSIQYRKMSEQEIKEKKWRKDVS